MIFPDPFFITLFKDKELYEESFFALNSTIKNIENDSNTENNIFNICKKKEIK